MDYQANNDLQKSVLLIGNYDPKHPKEAVIGKALAAAGIRVREVRLKVKVLGSVIHKIFKLPSLFGEVKKALSQFWDFDTIIVAHGNYLAVPIVRICLSRKRRVPLIFDAFDPQYAMSRTRGDSFFKSIFIWIYEKISFAFADKILVVAEAMKKYYGKTYKIPLSKIAVVPCGADEEKWKVSDLYEATKPYNSFKVVYWGRFHKHHGLNNIMKAAEKLKDEDVEFIFAGTRNKSGYMQKEVIKRGLNNVRFTGYLPDDKLVELVQDADVCLGMFGGEIPAVKSISWKVSEALSMGKPVITERSEASEEHLVHKENAYLVEPGTYLSIKDAIISLKNSPELRKTLSRKARLCYEERFSTAKIGGLLKSIIQEFHYKG